MMYTSSAQTMNKMDLPAWTQGPVATNRPVHAALKLYNEARRPDWIGKLWSALTGRSRQLLHLSDVQASGALHGCHYAGTRPVPIGHIRGSEGRCEDFDAGFRPLKVHNKGRWVSIAKARLQGVVLPPVDLIQVGDAYFVRDGHHRISVARAFGQTDIDAEVTVWEVASPPSRERSAPVARLAAQPA